MEDYFIGVHAREIERLRDQHAAWRPETAALWARAGFRAGQHLADLGSGPGFSALDLAPIVGDSGRVIALDKASPYLDFLNDEKRRKSLSNVETLQADLTQIEVMDRVLDGAFCRFFLAFLVADLDRVLACIHRSLKPGGMLAAMEYLTLDTTICCPPVRGFDAHTQAWMRYYLNHGGDTAIGQYLPERLSRAGFEITHEAHVGGLADPSHRWWSWWGRLIEDFGDKLAAEGLMEQHELSDLRHDWSQISNREDAFIRTPTLIQLVARKS